jgi:hypothetical protein
MPHEIKHFGACATPLSTGAFGRTWDARSRAFGRSPVGRGLQCATFGLVVASGLLKPACSDAAITMPADQAAALLLGDEFASQDRIRSTVFTNNVTGAVIRGNAMPLGAYYSGISYHWITYLQNLWGTSDFSISVAVGVDRTNPTQSTSVLSVNRMPGQDFAILEQQAPFSGAAFPEFWNAPLVRNQVVTGVGFGPQQVWGSSAITDNGHAEAVHMRVYNTRDPFDIGLTNDADVTPDGGFINFNSTSVIYVFDQAAQKWKISAAIQTGVPVNPSNPLVINGALDMHASGAATFVNNNTPRNGTIPEPTTTVSLLLVAGGQVELAMSNLVANRMYRVMRSPELAPAVWTEAHTFTAASISATWSESPPPGGRMFYRLEWVE